VSASRVSAADSWSVFLADPRGRILGWHRVGFSRAGRPSGVAMVVRRSHPSAPESRAAIAMQRWVSPALSVFPAQSRAWTLTGF